MKIMKINQILPIIIFGVFVILFYTFMRRQPSYQESYIFHSSCPCKRFRNRYFDVSSNDSLQKSENFLVTSTCDRYTSSLGTVQNVLSYAYYNDPYSTEDARGLYGDFMSEVAQSAAELYPGWRIRIYHNISDDELDQLSNMCQIYCRYPHVDFCNTNNLPVIGDLNHRSQNGMVWRFLPLGDPTVGKFLSRDLDSWILPREREAVREWENSNKLYQFHLIRDHPYHRVVMLGGLWGANNYVNFSRAVTLREQIFSRKTPSCKGSDQKALLEIVWPVARHNAMIHDSQHCGEENRKQWGKVTPFPTQKTDGGLVLDPGDGQD